VSSAPSEMDLFRTLNSPTPVILDAAGRMIGGVSFCSVRQEHTDGALGPRPRRGARDCVAGAWFARHQSEVSPCIFNGTFRIVHRKARAP
jgi:hypothetical protein